jgi:hypothetical protein
MSLIKKIYLFTLLISFNALLSAQVLTEKTTDLGFGFKQIEHAQVNVAGRWKSNVKFHFLYHEKRRLCQCTLHSISATGRYAIFQEMATKEVFVFHANVNERELLQKIPQTSLKEIDWNKNETRAQLRFQISDSEELKTISIRIKKKKKKTSH